MLNEAFCRVECPSVKDQNRLSIPRTCCLQRGSRLTRGSGRNIDVINIQLLKTGNHADIKKFEEAKTAR